MDFCQSLFDVASENTKIHSFFEFAQNIHNLMACTEEDCDIGIFLNSFEKVLLNPNNSYDALRNFFVSHCLNYPKVFGYRINLKNNEQYVIKLLKGLRYLREDRGKTNFEN